MELLKENKTKGFDIQTAQSTVHTRVYEDNSGAIEIAKHHKYRPRTKHLNNRLHHFRDYVSRSEVSIHPIGTDQQQADYLTKSLNKETLRKLRFLVMGW